MNPNSDRVILRELCQRYLAVCADPDQHRRRRMWRHLNSLKPMAPLIYVRAFAWAEMAASACRCADPLYREYESFFREMIFRSTLGDDYIFEPWVTVNATYHCTGWGPTVARVFSEEPHGAFKVDYPIKDLSDLDALRFPEHRIDEESTARRVGKLTDAIGDLIPINVDRGPAYRMWTGDLSTDLGDLRGMEHFMMDLIDEPEKLARLVGFLRDGVLATHEQAERDGDWGLGAHQNQAMPYAEELADPAANENGVRRDQLWGYMASQEFTAVGPELWNDFMFTYQKPILERFGLVAYGCCEDLTRKIPYLRTLKNLRRIAVSPFACVKQCAEAIGGDYVISYRPSPSDMVSYGWDEDRVRRIVGTDLAVLRANGCQADITLKDVETVQNDPDRVRTWVRIVREVIAEVWTGT